MESLDAVLADVHTVIERAKREGETSRSEAERWRRECDRYRERVEQLEAELDTCKAKLCSAVQQAQHAHGSKPLAIPSLPPRVVGRRNTVAAGYANAEHHSSMPDPTALSSACSTLQRLRRYSFPHWRPSSDPQQDMQQENSQHAKHELCRETSWDASGSTNGGLTLSRLSRLLGACLLLETASTACSATGEGARGDEEDGLGVQAGVAGKGDQAFPTYREGQLVTQSSFPEGEAQVSLLDDGRGAGVGATAAAAVSVALAKSWATAAGSGHQRLPRLLREEVGGGRKGKGEEAGNGRAAQGQGGRQHARFKLMAAVPRSQARRSRIQTSESRVSLAPDAPATAGEEGGQGRAGSAHRSNLLFPSDSNMALDSILPTSAGGLDDEQEATWRASGSHLKLQWMSNPSTVLVTCKPTPAVRPSCVQALSWLLRRGVYAYVEPAVHAELAAALAHELAGTEKEGGQPQPQPQASSPSPTSSPNRREAKRPLLPPLHPGVGGAAPHQAPPAGVAPRQHEVLGDVDLSAQLLTWDPCACCDNFIPSWVAEELDLVITLGGDGTVLWTCSMFANGAVPPIVPFAMGSLGFMTPFPIQRMESVLRRTTTRERGFPIMLRHRLQCRILRAGTSAADLVQGQQQQQQGGDAEGDSPPAHAQLDVLPPAPCGDEMVVLNEVVIDRGATASLTNLQVYVDHNFVTAVQGDGLIVATPSGSTAYSLAAGGSMVHPGVPALLFTPICPHTIASRPLVFPEHVVLRVKVPTDSRSEAYCSFDGRARQLLRPGDSLLIRMSPWPVPMVCSLDASHDWFLSVREGLSWNLRKVQAGKGS